LKGGIGVDLVALNERVAAVEAAAGDSAARQRAAIHELDRLAEHLVGESAPEVQGVKERIQRLITRLAPERHDVIVYVQIYCHGSRV